MSTNNLEARTDGRSIIVDDINQYKNAMVENYVPRNSTGVVEGESGSLGTASIQWLDAFIASGFWNAGDIKAHHTYNGIADINQGWFPCDGSIINETNYNLIHGAGSWASNISASIFDGKYSPNLIGKYLSGNIATDSDGSTLIPSVGNTNNSINIQHYHSTQAHNHQWFIEDGGGTAQGFLQLFGSGHTDRSYNSSGGFVSNLSPSGSIDGLPDVYTSNKTPNTNYSSSATQNIQPESIEVIFYLRII